MVPGTPHGVSHDHAVCERTVVVRAMRAYREKRIAMTSEKYVIGIDAADDHCAIREIAKRHTAPEIAC